MAQDEDASTALLRLVERFESGPMGDAEIDAFVSEARPAASHTSQAEIVRLVSRAFYRAIDPKRPGSRAITAPAYGRLRNLHDDALAGKILGAGAATRAGAQATTYPVMAGFGDPWVWRRVDSSEGLGNDWRGALGLSSSFQMLGGCNALFISPHAAGKTDPLGFPVRLASGYYADPAESGLVQQDATGKGELQSCRTALAQAISHDNSCLTDGAGTVVCADRQVERIGRSICDHYDGAGNLYLAECDCLKRSNTPQESRLYSSCVAAVERNQYRYNRWAWEKDLAEEDCRRLNVADLSTKNWGLPALPSRISDPIAQNMIARYMSRSYYKLDRFAGYPVGCFYPPCSDRYSSYGYTDAAQVFSDLAACPDVRCSASINVNWVSNDVTITGNALEVRCDGGPCLVSGLPRCKNGGRCIPVPGVSIEEPDEKQVLCNCTGTGFGGPTCEVADGTTPDSTGSQGGTDPKDQLLEGLSQSAQIGAQLLAASATGAEETRKTIVIGLWTLGGLVAISFVLMLVRMFVRRS
jgi:hypothetical protein